MSPQVRIDLPLPTSNVLGIPLFAGSIPEIVDRIISICDQENKTSRCVSATGAHGLVTARQDPEFFQTLKKFYANLPDGRPGVWISHLKGAKTMQQCPGADFFAALISSTASTRITHFFCGGNNGVAEKLKQSCDRKFNNTQVVGTFTPPFRQMTEIEINELAAHINQCAPDILWIGISSPKQELFATRIAPLVNVNFIICVGAAFDFHSGNLRRAPRIVQTLGIEWLYRLCKEPRRLYKRTLTVVPKFIVFNFIELFTSFFQKNIKGRQV